MPFKNHSEIKSVQLGFLAVVSVPARATRYSADSCVGLTEDSDPDELRRGPGICILAEYSG